MSVATTPCPAGRVHAARALLLSAAAVMSTVVCATPAATVSAAPAFKLAWYNIRSGKGSQALRGHAAPFADTDNCTDRSAPVNAWGAGAVQKVLENRVKDDPEMVALGLAEAWHCASPRNVRQMLGWTAGKEERNGTALLARYGFAGPQRWRQLDTSRNKNPRDAMWVVGAAVCLDPECAGTVDVYAAHWAGTGPESQATYDQQARETVAFMSASHGPHVLMGDLNIFEASDNRPVCHQRPNNRSLNILRNAGYVDAWAALHGSVPGFTGMTNRAGCGAPEGAAWKRIDYAWSKNLTPVRAATFGVVPPGDAAPSDHYGLAAEYKMPR